MGGDVLSDILYGLGQAARRATTIGGDPEAVASVRSGERLMAQEDAGRAMGLNPARRGVFDPVIDEVSAGYRGTEAPPNGHIALPAPPPPMMPTPRPAPPSSRGVPLRPTGEAVKERDERSRAAASSSTQGGTATGPLNPSVAGQPPRIPAWMAAGSQPRFTPTAEQRSSQDAVFNDLAGSLGHGETLSRNLPGSMANIYSDIGFDQAMDARDQATLARTKTSIDQEKAAQVLDDLTGGTQKRIRGLALDNALVDMLPAGSKGRIGANYGAGWGPGLSGSEVGSEAVGETPLGAPTIGDEREMDRIIAGQQGKLAASALEHESRAHQEKVVNRLRKAQGDIQARYASGEYTPERAKHEWKAERDRAILELQAFAGGKQFVPTQNTGSLTDEDSEFFTKEKTAGQS